MGRRSRSFSNDNTVVNEQQSAMADIPGGLLDLYDIALPHVHGYLSARCDARGLVEDLTAETFLAAVDAVRRKDPPTLSVP